MLFLRNMRELVGRGQKAVMSLIITGLLLAQPASAGGPPPVILVQPLDVSVLFLNTASFSVVALSGTTMSYQWLKNGTNIPGATSASYSVPNCQNTDAGNYAVVVQNAGGSVTSWTASLSVMAAPTIVVPPLSQLAIVGKSASFTTVAIGNGTLSYQWYLNGSSLGNSHGARTSTYSLTNVTTSDAGNYTVVVKNSYGSTTSLVASLTVFVPPSIMKQPASQTAVAGQTAAFSATVSGTGPLSYQWNFNGTPLAGATNATLSISNVLPAANGNYSLVVTNTAGVVTSAVANLAVTLPSVVLMPTTGTAGLTTNGFGFQFAVPTGVTYVVLASTDLQTWTPIATNTAANASAAFNDAAAGNFDHRYYRVTFP